MIFTEHHKLKIDKSRGEGLRCVSSFALGFVAFMLHLTKNEQGTGDDGVEWASDLQGTDTW